MKVLGEAHAAALQIDSREMLPLNMANVAAPVVECAVTPSGGSFLKALYASRIAVLNHRDREVVEALFPLDRPPERTNKASDFLNSFVQSK